jgi:FkbM family methyltransferase
MLGLMSTNAAQAGRLLNRVGLRGINQILKRVVKILTRDKLTIQVDGLSIQGPTVSWRILHQLAEGHFEALEVDLFRKSLTPGMIVLDVGANVGYYTLTAARIVGGSGRVFSFEPDPRSGKSLAANVLANGLGNVTIVNKAVSDDETAHEMYLSLSANRSSLHRTPSLDRVERTCQVETTTVDVVLNGLTADVVKMDIEGNEPAALRGMERSLRRETVLFMEFSPSTLASAGTDSDEFFRLLCERFAKVEMISNHGLMSMTAPPDQLTNLRCTGWRVSV